MHIAITGASGLIGTALTAHLHATGHQVTPVVRRGTDGIGWDPVIDHIEAHKLEGIDGVVHLAGAGIADHRWTEDYKATLLESRVKGTALLARTLASLTNPPAVLLSGSAIGYYGSRGDEILTEDSGPGTGFLPELCQAWEAETAPAEAAGIRVAHLRTGIVLSSEGGALAKQLPLFKFGLGAKMGSGEQWQSWISMTDQVGLIEWLLTTDAVAGPVNMTAPEPVTNATFTDTLGSVLGRPTFMPIPRFGPKLLLGAELAQNLLFDSARIHPAAATAAGYEFTHPTLEPALRAELGR